MRIDGPNRSAGVSGGSARRPAGASSFSLPPEGPAARPAAVSVPQGVYDVAALMALQSVEGPAERRRRAIKRGFDLLDGLDALRIELLGGGIAPERLEHIAALVRDRAPSDDPRIAGLLDDIELRARVELAKTGRYLD